MIWLFRLAHGLTLAIGIWLDVKLLMQIPAPGSDGYRHFSAKQLLFELLILTISLAVQGAIAWFSWWRFNRSPFRIAFALFAIWFLAFVFHPWFNLGPIRFGSTDAPEANEEIKKFGWCFLFVCGQSIFPLLRRQART